MFRLLSIVVLFSIPFTVNSAPPLTVTVGGEGTVTSSPGGIVCPSDCQEKFAEGTLITLDAYPPENFDYWGGDCAGQTGPQCLVIKEGKVTISAMFAAAPEPVTYPAPVPVTGQTTCVDYSGNEISCVGTGQDGEYQIGEIPPTPRFTDNEDGTVTDNMTGLMWTSAICRVNKDWQTAIDYIEDLNTGTVACSGLVAAYSDWRMPNIKELFSLADFNRSTVFPGIAEADSPDFPFNITNQTIWSSTARKYIYGSDMWCFHGDSSGISGCNRVWSASVWPVRGPVSQ